MKKWWLGLILFLLIVLIRILFFPDTKADENSPGIKKSPVPVKICIVKKEILGELFYCSGDLLANESVNLSPEINGRLEKIYFKEGEKVTKGDILAKLNDADLQASKRKIKAHLQLAESKEKKLRKMLDVEGISKEEYEIALTDIEITLAELQSIESQIEKTLIRAPFSGIIGLRNYSAGSIINTNSILATLQEIEQLNLDFSLPEKYTSHIKPGQNIYFKTNDSNEKLMGTVIAIEPTIDLKTRTLKVRAKVKNTKKNILPGMFASVEVNLKAQEESIYIPTESVIADMKGKKVFIVKNGTAEARIIQAGLRTDSKIQVLEGISAGDTLIISGISNLRDKARVKLIQN